MIVYMKNEKNFQIFLGTNVMFIYVFVDYYLNISSFFIIVVWECRRRKKPVRFKSLSFEYFSFLCLFYVFDWHAIRLIGMRFPQYSKRENANDRDVLKSQLRALSPRLKERKCQRRGRTNNDQPVVITTSTTNKMAMRSLHIPRFSPNRSISRDP